MYRRKTGLGGLACVQTGKFDLCLLTSVYGCSMTIGEMSVVKDKIDDLIKSINAIPPLPEISSSVLAALNSEEVAIVEVSELIEKDIALASQLLKVANSPAYGAISTISSIQHAIMMLGLDEVRALLLAFAVERFFSEDTSHSEVRQRYWVHSRVCSYAALLLSHHFRQGDSGSFFLAGLVHDIGKLIIDQFLHEEFLQIVAQVKTEQCSFSEAEKDILGVTHYVVGGKLLQHWNFPKQVIMQVYLHNTPWRESEFTSGAFIIYLANILAKIAGYSCLQEERVPTLEQFSKSRSLHIIKENGFALDVSILEQFIGQIEEFVAVDKV